MTLAIAQWPCTCFACLIPCFNFSQLKGEWVIEHFLWEPLLIGGWLDLKWSTALYRAYLCIFGNAVSIVVDCGLIGAVMQNLQIGYSYKSAHVCRAIEMQAQMQVNSDCLLIGKRNPLVLAFACRNNLLISVGICTFSQNIATTICSYYVNSTAFLLFPETAHCVPEAFVFQEVHYQMYIFPSLYVCI